MKIILYSTGCPMCGVLEKKLANKQIQYTLVDSVDTMIGMGITAVPVLSVDGTLMSFRDAVNWVNNIEEVINEHSTKDE